MGRKAAGTGMASMMIRQQELMAKYSYYIDMVPGETVHTHGLEETFGHPEIECILPIDPRILMTLLNDLGSRIKKGTRFSHGDVIPDLIEKFPVKLVASPHGLRLILPDPKGELSRDKMDPAYAMQYDGLHSDWLH